MLLFPSGENICECHVVAFGDIPARQTGEGLKSVGLSRVIPDDCFIFYGGPWAGALPGQLIDRSGPVWPLQCLARLGNLLFPAPAAERRIGRDFLAALDAIH